MALPFAAPSLHEPALDQFFIFNPTLGQKEGTEMEKIIYYYPEDTGEDTQNRNTGLASALVNFTSTFSKKRPVEVIYTNRYRQVFYNPEPDIWFVMWVENAYVVKGKDEVEYKPQHVYDQALQAIVEQIYSMFKLFHGTMSRVLEVSSQEILCDTVALFMRPYVSTIDIARLDMFNTLNGIHYLPVDKNIYLKIQCFVNAVEHTFPNVRYSCFLYKGHLVWSGLGQSDMRILYKYLIDEVSASSITQMSATPRVAPVKRTAPSAAGSSGAAGSSTDQPAAPAAETSTGSTGSGRRRGESGSSAGGSTAGSSNYDNNSSNNAAGRSPSKGSGASSGALGKKSLPSGFLSGPDDIDDPNTAITAPRIFVNDGDECYLVVYQVQRMVVVFLIDLEALNDIDFYRRLDAFTSPLLYNLVPVISSVNAHLVIPEDEHKYIYFNHMNLAIKSSIRRKGDISRDIQALLFQLKAELDKSAEGVTEVDVKTDSEWLVARKSDSRELFVVFENQKKVNLIDVSEEVAKLSAMTFGNIFID